MEKKLKSLRRAVFFKYTNREKTTSHLQQRTCNVHVMFKRDESTASGTVSSTTATRFLLPSLRATRKTTIPLPRRGYYAPDGGGGVDIVIIGIKL